MKSELTCKWCSTSFFQMHNTRFYVCVHMHKWGNEKDERNTQKRGCWALGSVCVQSAHLPVSVCVASWLVVCEWECYWEIFLILCVSSSHLPQQETSEGSWKTFPTQLSFKYTHTQIHTPWHTVSEVFHMAPVASLKVKKRELARLLKVFFFFYESLSESLWGNFTWTRMLS